MAVFSILGAVFVSVLEIEIYHKRLGPVNKEAEKSRSLLSAGWRHRGRRSGTEGRSWRAPSPLVCGLGFSPEGEGAGRGVWLPEELRSRGRGCAGAKGSLLKSGGLSECLRLGSECLRLGIKCLGSPDWQLFVNNLEW